MHPLEAAILRTLVYADIFHFPLTLPELYFYLIHDEPASQRDIQQMLLQSPVLQSRLCMADGYIALAESQHIIALRQEREQLVQRLQPQAARYSRWLARIPFVRMVALTGALAARNPAHLHDDFDYLLVTQPGRVWIARAFAIIIVRLVRRQGHELCPNYVLAADNLKQRRQDLYIARELVQMLPLYGQAVYAEMWRVNCWLQHFFPNASPLRLPEDTPRNYVKQSIEFLLGGRLGDWLENWEYRRKWVRFAQMAKQPEADAQLDSSSVKGHFQDHGQRILRLYEEGLKAHGL